MAAADGMAKNMQMFLRIKDGFISDKLTIEKERRKDGIVGRK
jgi:hypothetical protein